MSAPLPEYTISGSYSSDRLRGARPRALLADWLLLFLPYFFSFSSSIIIISFFSSSSRLSHTFLL